MLNKQAVVKVWWTSKDYKNGVVLTEGGETRVPLIWGSHGFLSGCHFLPNYLTLPSCGLLVYCSVREKANYIHYYWNIISGELISHQSKENYSTYQSDL